MQLTNTEIYKLKSIHNVQIGVHLKMNTMSHLSIYSQASAAVNICKCK